MLSKPYWNWLLSIRISKEIWRWSQQKSIKIFLTKICIQNVPYITHNNQSWSSIFCVTCLQLAFQCFQYSFRQYNIHTFIFQEVIFLDCYYRWPVSTKRDSNWSFMAEVTHTWWTQEILWKSSICLSWQWATFSAIHFFTCNSSV